VEDEPEVLLEVGGPVDELSVTLAIYGEDLEPLEIEKILDVTPTSAHRRGDRKPRGPEFKEGAYVVAVRATSPEEVGRVLDDLLGQVPDSDGVWETLGTRYRVQVRFAAHIGSWNRGFGISAAQVRRLARMKAELEFDIYAYTDE